MLVTNESVSAVEVDATMWAGVKQAPAIRHLDVVLKPLNRPDLSEIRVDVAAFAIGRTEHPFVSYGNDILNMLSRRHASIFRKDGFVYLIDLQSRNGTTVNRVGIGHAPCQLRDGDEICFGGALSYRIQITPRSRPEGSLTLTLTPESGGSGLETIVVSKFPFLISKTDGIFSHYKGDGGHGGELRYLSRRHAHIYQKGDQVYIGDLGSANGTFIDGQRLQEHAAPLKDGSVIAFGGKHFVYRVSIIQESVAQPAVRSDAPPQSMTEVRPQAKAPEIKPKAPEVKAKIFGPKPKADIKPPKVDVKPKAPEVKPQVAEVKPKPAEAKPQAAEVKPKAAEAKPKAPEVKPQAEAKPPAEAKPAAGGDLNLLAMDSGTQFMAAPTSFLNILCASDEPKPAVAAAAVTTPAAVPNKEPSAKRRPRSRAMLLLSELVTLIKGEPDSTPRRKWKFAAVGGALVALALISYFWNASERALKDAVARGDYARAATLASRLLEKHPDDVELRARATEVGLKATVPTWLAKVRARDFDGAKVALTGTSELSKSDSDLRPLIDELEWLGSLERLVSDRGGPEAPIRIYADEDSIEHLIARWNDDTGEHQRALARIASRVPQFGDWYGEALTHLRRLQSESTVYLPVIERVKTNIGTELARDNADALRPVLKEIAEKYPRLGGMDSVRQDLARYIEIRQEARSRKSGRLFALLGKARFVTPPFQQSFHALVAGGQLPSAQLIQQYEAATQAWKAHNPAESLAGLQKIAAGPWADEISHELERRQAVAARFATLQQSHNANDFVDQLLAFRESLDADEDVYFVRATAADLNQQKARVIARAQDAMNQARTYWQEYRSNGAIDASQRIETSISNEFRIRANLLSEASKYARQSFLIYSQVDAAGAAQWTAVRDEIEAEAREQRARLRDLSNVVEPALLKDKLALLGDTNE